MFKLSKQFRKVLFDYLIALIVYVVFLPIVITIGKDNFIKGIPYYSGFIFLLFLLVLWTDIYEMGRKEKKPMYKLNPPAHKGLYIGILGFLPYAFLQLIATTFANTKGVELGFNENLMALFKNLFLAPLYGVTSLLGAGIFAYIVTFMLVPLICYLAYIMGHYDITKAKIKTFFNQYRKK